MVKLSDRLKRLADEVKSGDRVADIGTDHGLLPIFLYENHIAESVILCDINEGPLEKAKRNIDEFGAAGLADLRRGDGLVPLAAGEVDTVVIAGMGGLLMIDILGADLEKTKSFKRLILQPRNGSEKLRKWLNDNGFIIYNESLVREGRYICEIISARSAEKEEWVWEALSGEISLEVSPLLIEKKDELLVPFLEKKIRREGKIISEIEEGSGDGEHERIGFAKERLAQFGALLEKVRKSL